MNNDYDFKYKQFLVDNYLPAEGEYGARTIEINPLGAVLPIGLYGTYRMMMDKGSRAEASPTFDATDDYLDLEREKAMQEAIARRRMMYGNADGVYR